MRLAAGMVFGYATLTQPAIMLLGGVFALGWTPCIGPALGTVLTLAYNEATAVRAMAEPGVIARLEACRGAWCEIAVGGLSGWLPRAALWGVGPDETIE